MSRHRPNTKGFLKHHQERGKPMFLVGAEDVSDKQNPYRGPVAKVMWDDTWLNICTDSYEGNAMLNIEALPHLRRALAKVAKAIKAKSKDGQSGEGK